MCVIVKSLSYHSWPISLIQWACFMLGWALESRQHHCLLCSNSVTHSAVSGLAINSISFVAVSKTVVNLLVIYMLLQYSIWLEWGKCTCICHLEVVSGSPLPVTSLWLCVVFVPHKMNHCNKCLCLPCCSTSRPDSSCDMIKEVPKWHRCH